MAIDTSTKNQEIEAFLRLLDTFHRHIQDFCQEIGSSAYISASLSYGLINQLQLALEELQVAQEEILQQNEELFMSKQTAQAEIARYQDLFEFSPEAYLVTDCHGVISEANHAAVSLFQVPKERLIGKSVASFVVVEDREAFRTQLSQVNQGIELKDWEVFFQPKQGEPFPVALTVNAAKNCRVSLRWLVRDIRAQKAHEKALQQAHELLEQKVKERTTELTILHEKFLKYAEQERLIGAITYQIRQSLDLDTILDTTAVEVRKFLQVDRVVIYRFKADWSGTVTVESVAPGRLPILYTVIEDPCFRNNYVSLYKEGRVKAIEDVYEAGLEQCYLTLLTDLQVRANLVVPILKGDELWGLMIAHHCQGPRSWQTSEIQLLSQLANQVSIAIQQAELYQKVKRLAIVDGLTQVSNRRHFDDHLKQVWQRLSEKQLPLSLILCDIDYFKFYNDTYGHPAGDDCLKRVASIMSGYAYRPSDVIARYGGEEFGIILPEMSLEKAGRMAETIRDSIEDLEIPHCKSALGVVTMSFGVSSLIPHESISLETLILTADRALYEAKANGRNQVYLKFAVAG